MGQFAYSSAFAQGDALQEPAVPSKIARHSLLLDIDRVGERLVAVGERGHVMLSDDMASSWTQAQVPVRVTLTSSFFIDDQQGWAVGHDGVVLYTNDGGQQWQKQLDGTQANQLILDHAQQLQSAAEVALENAPEDQREQLEMDLENRIFEAEDAASFIVEGASRPFLGVWFKNDNEGYISGAFGMFLATTDGGNSWSSVAERIDNTEGFHLNAIIPIGEQLFIVAESGGLYRSDDLGQSWKPLASPYEGSFFGINGDGQGQLIAYGLRGNAFISLDNGDSWKAIETATKTTLFSSTRLDDGSTLLMGNSGIILQVDAQGRLLQTSSSQRKLPISAAITIGAGKLVTAGFGGLQTHNTTDILAGAK
ncbi:MAG: YCF48-related protein [Motiliproteus sp.]